MGNDTPDDRRNADARARMAATAPAPVHYLLMLDRVMMEMLAANSARRLGVGVKASDVRVLVTHGDGYANIIGVDYNEEDKVLEIVVDDFS